MSRNLLTRTVPGERIGFEVYARAGGTCGKRGSREGFGDQRDFKPSAAGARYRKTHAVDGDKAFGGDQRRDRGRRFDPYAFTLPFRYALEHSCRGVDMAVDEMAAKPTAEFDQKVGGQPQAITNFVAALYNAAPAR